MFVLLFLITLCSSSYLFSAAAAAVAAPQAIVKQEEVMPLFAPGGPGGVNGDTPIKIPGHEVTVPQKYYADFLSAAHALCKKLKYVSNNKVAINTLLTNIKPEYYRNYGITFDALISNYVPFNSTVAKLEADFLYNQRNSTNEIQAGALAHYRSCIDGSPLEIAETLVQINPKYYQAFAKAVNDCLAQIGSNHVARIAGLMYLVKPELYQDFAVAICKVWSEDLGESEEESESEKIVLIQGMAESYPFSLDAAPPADLKPAAASFLPKKNIFMQKVENNEFGPILAEEANKQALRIWEITNFDPSQLKYIIFKEETDLGEAGVKISGVSRRLAISKYNKDTGSKIIPEQYLAPIQITEADVVDWDKGAMQVWKETGYNASMLGFIRFSSIEAKRKALASHR